MKKILSVSMFVAALCVIGATVTGCKDSTTKPAVVDDKNKKEVTIVAITDTTELEKKGDKKITVTIKEKATEDLTLTAVAKDVDAKVLKGTGTIKKDATTGDITISTDGYDGKVTEVKIYAKSAGTKDAETTVKTKLKS